MFEVIIFLALALIATGICAVLFFLNELAQDIRDMRFMVEDFTNEKYYR